MMALFGAWILLFSFSELFSDLNLALKLFALLAIISFVYSHLGKGPVSLALIAGISVFVLFDYWKFFGGIFLLYTLLTLGISGVLVDFFFVSNMSAGQENPDMDSLKMAQRAQALQAANEMHHHAASQSGMQYRVPMPPPGGSAGPQRPGPQRPMGR
ncbi:MAG: hypothetical protein QXK06_00065 [Candidatus Diapherotrites archaeon]